MCGNLNRFIVAQEQGIDGARIDRALTELANGRKISHWMWYVFPQIQGLGKSPISLKYAIADIQEARHYLKNEKLRTNLYEALKLALESEKTAKEIFGSVDELKLRSSLTLFLVAAKMENSLEAINIFKKALKYFFDDQLDAATTQLLRPHVDSTFLLG